MKRTIFIYTLFILCLLYLRGLEGWSTGEVWLMIVSLALGYTGIVIGFQKPPSKKAGK